MIKAQLFLMFIILAHLPIWSSDYSRIKNNTALPVSLVLRFDDKSTKLYPLKPYQAIIIYYVEPKKMVIPYAYDPTPVRSIKKATILTAQFIENGAPASECALIGKPCGNYSIKAERKLPCGQWIGIVIQEER